MPSLKQLLVLSTLFLSGALSAPVAGNGLGIGGSPHFSSGFGLTRGHKREAEASPAPGGIGIGGSFSGGLTRGHKREAEASPAPGGIGGNPSGGLTRGHKREPEPGNIGLGGHFSGGLTRGHKRQEFANGVEVIDTEITADDTEVAEPEIEVPEVDDAAEADTDDEAELVERQFGFKGINGAAGTQDSKRDASPEPGNIGINGRPGVRLTGGHKREAEASPEPGFIIGTPKFPGGGLHRTGKREAEAEPIVEMVETREAAPEPEPGNIGIGGSFAGGLTRGH